MIVLNLVCSNHHRFEGWFSSSGEFTRQLEGGYLACPMCNSDQITRLPSAPHVVKRLATEAHRPDHTPPVASKVADTSEAVLHAILMKLIKESENVGERFAVEARKIHYNEVPPRQIRGTSTPDETAELLEEGIPLVPLPYVPDGEVQ